MAPIYADHPFPLLQTPVFAHKQAGTAADFFDYCGSEMAVVHNMLIRGLNAIYLQAPHIAPADEPGFLLFMRTWHTILHAHHSGEEAQFFPDVEAMAGEPGVMEANVEQHHGFQAPLEALHAYVEACAAGADRYDGARVVALIDAFGPALARHLAEEIPTLQALRRYGEERMTNLQKAMDKEGEDNTKKVGVQGLAIVCSMIDIHYEDDLWIAWPPAPAVVKFLARNVLWWFVGDAAKFGPCDRKGNLKPLLAVPAEAEK